jgi:hypothetical protein
MNLGNLMFDYFKDRRFAPIFFVTILMLTGAILLLKDVPLGFQLEYALPGLMLLLAAFLLREFRQIRADRRNRYKSSPLSRDEKTKARSKLITKSTFKKS